MTRWGRDVLSVARGRRIPCLHCGKLTYIDEVHKCSKLRRALKQAAKRVEGSK